MGETLKSLGKLIVQFAKDIDTVYQDYEADKQAIGEDIEEIALKAALEELKETASEHFDQMLALAKTFLEDLKQLPEGDIPEQNESL
jgi:hypothetical protein